MVAYSFKQQFVPPIQAGTKRQTIRAHGKRRHARPGDHLQLYQGMRTKSCALIATSMCIRCSSVIIDFENERITYDYNRGQMTIYPGGLDEFARRDGFDDWPAMRAFWAKEHAAVPVFHGRLIQWTDLD